LFVLNVLECALVIILFLFLSLLSLIHSNITILHACWVRKHCVVLLTIIWCIAGKHVHMVMILSIHKTSCLLTLWYTYIYHVECDVEKGPTSHRRKPAIKKDFWWIDVDYFWFVCCLIFSLLLLLFFLFSSFSFQQIHHHRLRKFRKLIYYKSDEVSSISFKKLYDK
jgi:hypothetical protein